MPPGVARTRLLAVALALLAGVVWWTSQGGSNARAVSVEMHDFGIRAPKRIAAGEVVLHVSNAGPDTHELLLARANGRKLPLRSDNLTVDETTLEPRTVGALEDVHPDTSRTWKLQLPPGRYVLFCNMSGHYLGGMHRELIVR
jgi:uncharacterized cupredoxin-like copper-binding protein